MNVLIWKYTKDNIKETDETVSSLREKYIFNTMPIEGGDYIGINRFDFDGRLHERDQARIITVDAFIMDSIREVHF